MTPVFRCVYRIHLNAPTGPASRVHGALRCPAPTSTSTLANASPENNCSPESPHLLLGRGGRWASPVWSASMRTLPTRSPCRPCSYALHLGPALRRRRIRQSAELFRPPQRDGDRVGSAERVDRRGTGSDVVLDEQVRTCRQSTGTPFRNTHFSPFLVVVAPAPNRLLQPGRPPARHRTVRRTPSAASSPSSPRSQDWDGSVSRRRRGSRVTDPDSAAGHAGFSRDAFTTDTINQPPTESRFIRRHG